MYISEVGGSETNREIVSFRSSRGEPTCLLTVLWSCSAWSLACGLSIRRFSPPLGQALQHQPGSLVC